MICVGVVAIKREIFFLLVSVVHCAVLLVCPTLGIGASVSCFFSVNQPGRNLTSQDANVACSQTELKKGHLCTFTSSTALQYLGRR